MKTLIFSFAVFCSAMVGALPVSVTSVPQGTDPKGPNGWWAKRHLERLALATNMPEVVFLGDSITHFWESKPSWKTYFVNPYRALNLGYCSDTTENVLWRIDHGELDGYQAKVVVLMIGTNNSGAKRCPEDTLLGIRKILDRVLEKQTSARVVLTSIFPRGKTHEDPARKLNDVVNRELPELADGKRVIWCDLTDRFLAPNGDLSPELFPDYLHPSVRGYEIWAGAIKPLIDTILAAPPEASVASVWPAYPQYYRFGTLAAIPSSDLTLARARYERALTNRSAIVSGPKAYDLVMLGGTVMSGWERQGAAELLELRKGYSVLNLACAGVNTRHLLWRLENGELDGYQAKLFMLTVGQDNHGFTPEETAEGITALVRTVRSRHPEAKVLLLPMLYRGDQKTAAARVHTQKVNEVLAKLADGDRVRWLDFNDKLLGPDGGVAREWAFCTVLASADVYELWRKELEPVLKDVCRAQ